MSSPSSSSTTKSAVTQEQFNLFHNIDRLLFSRLLRTLRRDPYQSMQIIAFWIWLEQTRLCRDVVDNLLGLPDDFLTVIANEADLILNVVHITESNIFPALDDFDVPITKSITKNRVSLGLLFEHRFRVVQSVENIVNEVCVRAFQDIVHVYEMEMNKSGGGDGDLDEFYLKQQLGGFGPVLSPVLPPVMFHGVVDPNPNSNHHQMMMNHNNNNINNNTMPQFYGPHQGFENEIGDLFNSLHLREEDQEVPPDERTIFLTFSKGYPITESDISDFIRRIYGDCIEAIHMQEVAAGEQPLYARLVVTSSGAMDVILKNKEKAKFSINGKHVWARKYVRKNTPLQPSSPSMM